MWRQGRRARRGPDGSCTCSLRRIAPPRKPGKMPPYHAIMRGLCHDSIPVILPVSGLGTPVTVCHATLCLTQLMRDGTGNASQAHHAAASTLQGAQGVCRPYPQAPLRGLCTGSRAAPACSLPPPPRMVPTQGRPRHVDTSRHFCPHPPCAYRGWVGLGNLRANGHPSGGPWRQLYCMACESDFLATHGTPLHGKRVPTERLCVTFVPGLSLAPCAPAALS